jgi:hypothetical protein
MAQNAPSAALWPPHGRARVSRLPVRDGAVSHVPPNACTSDSGVTPAGVTVPKNGGSPRRPTHSKGLQSTDEIELTVTGAG